MAAPADSFALSAVLIDRRRVSSPVDGESNFHAFYQLLSQKTALPEPTLSRQPSAYRCLNSAAAGKRRAVGGMTDGAARQVVTAVLPEVRRAI